MLSDENFYGKLRSFTDLIVLKYLWGKLTYKLQHNLLNKIIKMETTFGIFRLEVLRRKFWLHIEQASGELSYPREMRKIYKKYLTM